VDDIRKIVDIEVPKELIFIVMELARITDHIICNSIVDTGVYWILYVFQFREKVYEIYEEICGACLTTNMGRIGGFERDWSPAFELIRRFLEDFQQLGKNLKIIRKK
jgi:NADH-quinone oxidoreductase subunit D